MKNYTHKTCCFLGPADIPKCDEQKIVTRVRYLLQPLIRQGVVFFGVGGRTGFDMFIAEYLLNQRDYYRQNIKVISVLPYPEWRQHWRNEEIRREDEILRLSDKVTYVSQTDGREAARRHVQKLVNESGYCVCFCNSMKGETADAVRYAMKQRLSVFNASSWDISQLK